MVDDVELLRKAMASLLEDHDVRCASDGSEAIDILRGDADWDMIVCDILMPNGTGKDVYEYVARELPGLAERIVFTSGGPDSEDSSAFLAALPNRVLYKPIDGQELLEIVADCPPRQTPRK